LESLNKHLHRTYFQWGTEYCRTESVVYHCIYQLFPPWAVHCICFAVYSCCCRVFRSNSNPMGPTFILTWKKKSS